MSNTDDFVSPLVSEVMSESNLSGGQTRQIFKYSGGLTKREHACIHLCIPETGDPELDAIIARARRDKFAAMALQGLLTTVKNEVWEEHDAAENSADAANALITALDESND